MFGGNKKKKGKKQQQRPEARPQAKSQPVRRSELLSSVISETVPSSSLQLIQKNTPMRFEGEMLAMCMMLPTDAIGGLSGKASKSDSAKGQFIEQIKNNLIHIHATADLMAENKILIIPDDETMESLEEYAFLSDEHMFSGFIPTMVTWDASGEMFLDELEGEERPFKWFYSALKGADRDVMAEVNTMFNEFLGYDEEDGEEEKGDPNAPLLDAEPSGNVSNAFAPQPNQSGSIEMGNGVSGIGPVEEEGSFSDDIPDAYTEQPVQDMPQPVPSGEAQAAAPGVQICPACGTTCVDGVCPACGWNVLSEEGDVDTEESVDVDMVVAAASHVFYKDDLDLSVSSNLFDTMVSNNPFVPLEENRGTGHVREYASQLAKNCNAELRALHQQNISKARTRFLHMMSNACTDIAHQVSISNENTVYFSMAAQIDQIYDQEAAESEGKIEARRRDLIEKWKAEKEEAIEAASRKAAKDYEERFARAHDTMLQDVSSDVLSDVLAKKDSSIRDMNVERRNTAQEMLNSAYANAQRQIAEEYEAMLDEEAETRRRYDKDLTDFVNIHLEDELKRDESIIKEADYQEKIKRMEADTNHRLAAVQAEHDARQQKWITERQDMEVKFAQREKEYQQRIDQMQIDSDRDKESISNLINECATTREKVTSDVAKDYELKINQMTEEKHRLEEQIRIIRENDRKLGRTSSVMWIAIAAVTLLIGLMLGGKVLPQGNQGQHYTLQLETQQSQEPAEENAVE